MHALAHPFPLSLYPQLHHNQQHRHPDCSRTMDSNAVRMLNELCASSLMALAYEVGPPSGAPHLPTFTATVRVTRHALGDMLVGAVQGAAQVQTHE